MTYFENRFNHPEMFAFDFGHNALSILNRALEQHELSLRDFKASEEETAQDMKDLYWNMSCEHDQQAKGLLTAYEIVTTRHVLNCAYNIREEIEYVKEATSLT